MQITPENLTVAEYASVASALGSKVEKFGNIYWSRGRGFFWRPLLPYVEYEPSKIVAPGPFCSGIHFVVPDEREANSTIGFVMLDSLPEYTLEKLHKKRRYLIRRAGQEMEIRPVQKLAELQKNGFAAYTSFYQRTRYGFLASRQRHENFCQWAEALLNQPKVLVLGCYGKEGLVAVSVSYWVEETLIYATYFCHSDALPQGAGELMFHALREMAARTRGMQQVFVRRYQGGNGMDQFYLIRDAKLVLKPAKLRIHPAINWAVKDWVSKRNAPKQDQPAT